MRYSTRQYAVALYESLEGKTGVDREKILLRFMRLLRRTGDARHLNAILVRVEQVYFERKGMAKVNVESASPLSESFKNEVALALGKPIELIETIDPKILAGVRILINDTILIDASALRRLESFQK